MRFLSLDGAPCRGLGQILVMKKLTQMRSIQFEKDFDVYIGSSWGAVLSFCLALSVPISEIEQAFEESQTYLNSRAYRLLYPFLPRMCPNKVTQPFYPFLQNKTLGDLKKRVICHGYDFQFKQLITFDSSNPKDKDLDLFSLVQKLTFAPSVFQPKFETTLIDASLATRSTLFFSLLQNFQEWKNLKINILHIGAGQKKQEGEKVRRLFQKGWLHWVLSKQIFEELESMGRSYQEHLCNRFIESQLYKDLKIISMCPLIEGQLDFSFMGDVSLTPKQIRKEVEGWMEVFPIDHLEF
ncbi:hypothetical protein EB008_02270 [bacterium]|nr:hypothetical protein [bacterium]